MGVADSKNAIFFLLVDVASGYQSEIDRDFGFGTSHCLLEDGVH
jgi:hypothetical protein